jgi:hypothetical protein
MTFSDRIMPEEPSTPVKVETFNVRPFARRRFVCAQFPRRKGPGAVKNPDMRTNMSHATPLVVETGAFRSEPANGFEQTCQATEFSSENSHELHS